MPIYEYSCRDCGITIEKIQKVGARSLRKCGECGGKLEKLVSRSAFHLKGGGWFDSGYTNSGKAGSADKSEKSGTSESTSSSKDTSTSKTKKKSSTKASSKGTD
jgi:putative FmdB family regulatory protein